MKRINEKTIELKGNELGWILKLAEEHYISDKFQKYIKQFKLEALDKFLQELMCYFHPNNFSAGHSETIWILTKKEAKNEKMD